MSLHAPTATRQVDQIHTTAQTNAHLNVCLSVYSPRPSSSGNIFRSNNKENSPDFDAGCSRARASQRSHNSSLSFNPDPQGLQGSVPGDEGVRGEDPPASSGMHDRGRKESGRSDKSKDAAAQW